MTLLRFLALYVGFCLFTASPGLADEEVFAGADEKTPSLAFYFDWINSQYEGTTEAQTLINLDFFKWLHDEYGMALDVYSLDVGNIDDGPVTAGVGYLIPDQYGSLETDTFMRQFPHGFDKICRKAASFGCRLGVWLGPDGFGNTPKEEQARIDMLVKLCRDYNFRLFKFDAVAGGLRVEKQDAFIRALKECRKLCPDLIVLNERIELGKAALYATTDLWEGVETYIDVFIWNEGTASHHRVGALGRELPPNLTRRIEDHGVCLSSCLDFWEDDLVLQTFNRGLILAPEIYGSPWLLRDDEFPKLARICNLFRRYGDILVNAKLLPEDRYGPYALSRGDGKIRFLTLRNLTWEPVRYAIKLDDSIGLASEGAVQVRRFHPSEKILGSRPFGDVMEIEVDPFRSCLVAASTVPLEEIGVKGCDYEVVRDTPGEPVVLKLLGLPGTRATLALDASGHRFTKAVLDGDPLSGFSEGEEIDIEFAGAPLRLPWHRKIAVLEPCDVPTDAEALFEATCFAADSNALEVRSLIRSGPSRIPQVQRARKAFFEQPMFVRRGIWDKNLFDGDMDTYFTARFKGGVLRIDFNEPLTMDRLVVRIKSKYDPLLNPDLQRFAEDNRAEISLDLETWKTVARWSGKGSFALAKLPPDQPIRYVRIHGAPARIAEVEGYGSAGMLDRSKWRASNLLGAYDKHPAQHAWSASLRLDEVPTGSYLAVALNGRHGKEGAYAAFRVDGKLAGAPDRSVSFPSNTWEYKNVDLDHGYTYYLPLTKDMANKKIDVVVLVLKGGVSEFKPEVYITAYPPPFVSKELVLTKAAE